MRIACPRDWRGEDVTAMNNAAQISHLELLKSLSRSFLIQKRALGFKYVSIEGTLNRLLRFVEFNGLEAPYLTQDLISDFCLPKIGEAPKTHANRCSDIRQFAKFLNMNEFEAYVPATPLKTRSSFTPYIFTHDEIGRIMSAADSIKSHKRYNCAEVYPILFRVLYGCGLRISEALNLKVCDVDMKQGVLTIRNSKFNKSRLVVMSASLTEACTALMSKIHLLTNDDDYFFKNRDGSQRNKGTVSDRFRELLWESNIPYRGKGYGPRLHDLRHSFCCHALKQMSQSGIDMYCSLPVLSTFIGHSSIKATERYLRLTEEFYPDIVQKMNTSLTSVYPEVYRADTY